MHPLLLPLGVAALLSLPMASLAQSPLGDVSPHARAERPVDAKGALTRAQAVDLAMQSSPEIAVAAREVEASGGALRQAGIIPNPELAASVEDTRYRETRTTSVQINQPLELGGKRTARVTAAERGRDLAIAELDAKRAEIRASVTSAFYDVLIAQERLRLAQASAELAKRATTAASKRVMAGKISPVEETRARVAESGVQIELAQARSELATARNRLAATWGAPQARFEQVEGGLNDMPLVPDWDVLAMQLEHSPNLARARIEVERRQALARVERARQIPDVTLSFGAKREEELGRNQAIVGISVPLPFFDRNQGNLQEALSRTDKAKDELVATEVRLQNDLAQSYQRLLTTRQEVDFYVKEILPGAQSAYDAATKGFEFGKFGFLDVLDAQRTLFQARSQYLRAVSDAHRAAADIDRLVGSADPSILQVKQ